MFPLFFKAFTTDQNLRFFRTLNCVWLRKKKFGENFEKTIKKIRKNSVKIYIQNSVCLFNPATSICSISASSLLSRSLPPYPVPFPGRRSYSVGYILNCSTVSLVCSSTALLLFCRSYFPFRYIFPILLAILLKKRFHCTLLFEFRSFWHLAWVHRSHSCHHSCTNMPTRALYFISFNMLLQSITNSILSTCKGI